MSEGVVENTIYRNVHTVQQQLQNIAKDDTIEYVYISDFDGNLFAHSFQGPFPLYLAENLATHNKQDPAKQRLPHKFTTSSGTIFEFCEPLIQDKKATLFIGINQKNIQALRLNTFKGVLWPTLIIGLVGLIIALLIGRRIHTPLYALSESIRRYGKGDAFSKFSLKTTDTDVKQLIDSFQNMIAARERAEFAQSEAEERIGPLLESTGQALYSVNVDGVCTFANSACAHTLGYEHPSELLGQNMHDLIHHTQQDGAPNPVENCRLYKAHTQGEKIRGEDEIFWRKDNSSFPVEYSSYPTLHDGKISGSVVAFRDITKRKQFQEALKYIAAGISSQTGEEFFQNLVIKLVELFKVKHAYIALISDSDPDLLQTFVLCEYGNIVHNISFEIKNTPCTEVVGKSFQVYSRQIQQLFPHDNILRTMNAESFIGVPLFNSKGKSLGLFAALDTEPMTDTQHLREILQIFAARAAAEIERLAAEQQLRNAQQKLRLHFQQTPLGVIEWDKDFNVRDWNPAASRIFGYSYEEAFGQHASDLIVPPAVKPHVDEIWSALIKRKGGGRSTNENITKTGETIMCEWYNTPLIADNGQVIGVASLVDDVTEKVRAKYELEQHRDRLEEMVVERTSEVQEQARIIDQIHDSVIATDLNGVVTSWNNGARQLFGYSKDEAIGKNITFVYPEEDLDMLHSLIKILQDNGEHEQEVRMHRKDGSLFYAHLSLSMLYDEDGTPRGMIGYSTDITDRILAQEELNKQKKSLEITNKELEAFSYSVSHDLRAPLRALHGFSEALQEDYADSLDDEGKDYLQRIQANAMRMSELIDDLLKLSRLGREELKVVSIDLSQLVHEVMEAQRNNFPERQIDFQLHDNGQVFGDLRLLRLAMENLINNALKYTSNVPQAHIEFGKNQQAGETVYYIRDNGTGFDMQYADKLFGVFQRLHGSNYEGTGIGLATVRRIIQRHFGRIWAEAEPGKGATFYFTLGLTEPPSSS
jgi:PAS domain S-box-containing protein